MIKKCYLSLVLVCATAVCAIQTALSQSSANPRSGVNVNFDNGDRDAQQTMTDIQNNINGVMLSIDLSNRVVTVGSTIMLSAQIKNASTNTITLNHIDIQSDFTAYLFGDSGYIYQLLPLFDKDKTNAKVIVTFSDTVTAVAINAGGTDNWNIPVTISNVIKPGDYTLKITRTFTMNGHDFRLVSNSLKIQVR